jgi:hypothetical protein
MVNTKPLEQGYTKAEVDNIVSALEARIAALEAGGNS